MKSIKLTAASRGEAAAFQIARLGLHEKMRPCLVDRPEGTGDYLLMLFHSPVTVRSLGKDSAWPASSLMIWTPKDGHFYGNLDEPWDHSWLHCAGRQVGLILRSSGLPPGRRIAMNDPSLVEKCLMEMIAELSGWRRPDERILRNIFENFARGLARQLFDQAVQLAPDGLLKVRTHLDRHYTEKQRLPDLARQIGWSVPHLCTEFKRFFGATIVQYLLHLRMSQAVYFLRDHNRRIGEIAQLVGYPDLYTFSKMFKRHFGLSPRSWRTAGAISLAGRATCHKPAGRRA